MSMNISHITHPFSWIAWESFIYMGLSNPICVLTEGLLCTLQSPFSLLQRIYALTGGDPVVESGSYR